MKKVLKLKLDPEVHEKFRSWAFNHRVTMQGELENYVGGLVDAGASVEAVERREVEVGQSKAKGIKTPPVPVSAPKQADVESVVTTGGLVKPTPEKPKVDQKTCKHSYNANMVCWKCGYQPA